jgi:uroporphyrinogen decarboxylase
MDDKKLVIETMTRLGETTLGLLENVLQHDCVGAVSFQDDIAYTSGLMISPVLLREIFVPWLERLSYLSHKYERSLLFHTDGDVSSLIPDIISAEVGALDPIQPKCMDIIAIKNQFGGRLALAGNIDLGYTLTRGAPGSNGSR